MSSDDFEWNAVIGKCLAYLSLKHSAFVDKSLTEQASFLERLGLPVEDCAQLIGTSAESLKALKRQAKAKKGHSKNGKAKR